MKHSETITTIAPDLVAALSEIKSVTKDAKNPFLKNKYASLDAIIEAAKPILAVHGLTAMQVVNDDGVETYLIHKSGEWISSDYIKIMPEVSKGLSLAQAIGVATTYAKRYQLGALLNISTDEDTDGQYGDNKDLRKPELTANNKDLRKPELTADNTEAFSNCVAAMKNGYTIDDIKKKWAIGEETYNKLMEAAQ